MLISPHCLDFLLSTDVFLFVPNVVGYLRLFLLIVSWTAHAFSKPSLSLFFYIFSAVLDFFDGWLARLCNQISSFGAWLDVFIDVLGRSMLWVMISSGSCFPWGQLVSSLEWTVFLCTHSTLGRNWKSKLTECQSMTLGQSTTTANQKTRGQTTDDGPSVGAKSLPAFVSSCFANGFRSPTGFFVIGGLHLLPPWLYVCSMRSDGLWPVFELVLKANFAVLPILVMGRIYCGLVEGWIVLDFVRHLGRLQS